MKRYLKIILIILGFLILLSLVFFNEKLKNPDEQINLEQAETLVKEQLRESYSIYHHEKDIDGNYKLYFQRENSEGCVVVYFISYDGSNIIREGEFCD